MPVPSEGNAGLGVRAVRARPLQLVAHLEHLADVPVCAEARVLSLTAQQALAGPALTATPVAHPPALSLGEDPRSGVPGPGEVGLASGSIPGSAFQSLYQQRPYLFPSRYAPPQLEGHVSLLPQTSSSRKPGANSLLGGGTGQRHGAAHLSRGPGQGQPEPAFQGPPRAEHSPSGLHLGRAHQSVIPGSRVRTVGTLPYVRELVAFLGELEDSNRSQAHAVVRERAALSAAREELAGAAKRAAAWEDKCRHLDHRLLQGSPGSSHPEPPTETPGLRRNSDADADAALRPPSPARGEPLTGSPSLVGRLDGAGHGPEGEDDGGGGVDPVQLARFLAQAQGAEADLRGGIPGKGNAATGRPV